MRTGTRKSRCSTESFKSHDILELIEQTGTTLSATEKYLVKRISEAAVGGGVIRVRLLIRGPAHLRNRF